MISEKKMKCIALFLVLSLVVLMAEPGECIWGTPIKRAVRGLRDLHGAVKRRNEDQALERVFERERAFA
ncbi:hypothetical protein PFLUV_G00215990 [Perca fluviatilis]|uniref:Uncharacterized protein n=1 Tax=Perca fluviatilis TaxID=8168 RepID=A0A6A5ES01_PERFL|nr:hypothetical protein PFLUV_G00215990 [Perca fluviatilis]